MTRIWHISDPHFGHSKVSKYRGFFTSNEADVQAHDETVYHSIVDNLFDGDTIRFYGDLSFIKDWRHGLNIVRQIKTERKGLRVELLYGNHDMIHPMFQGKALEVYEEYASVFDWLGERLHNTVDYGRSVHFSHFPAVNGGDVHSDKYLPWQIPGQHLDLSGSSEADWVIHGHTHQKTMFDVSRPNHLCVSWDVFRAPVSDDFLKTSIGNIGAVQTTVVDNWGQWEQYRKTAEFLQSTGAE